MAASDHPWFKGRAEAAGYDMESVPLVPDPVRAKTWRVFARCYAKIAAASGVGSDHNLVR